MKEFKTIPEIVNNILNVNALLIILQQRLGMTEGEFVEAKRKAEAELRADHPELFR